MTEDVLGMSVPIDLELLGYSGRWQALSAEHVAAGLVPARVVRAERGFALLVTADGVIRGEVSATFRNAATSPEDFPAAGDWVAVDTVSEHEVPLIEAVLPRSSAFIRTDPGKHGNAQVLAANIDTVFVVHAIVDEPNVRRIERELALAWESGATPVVVLSKADLSADMEAAVEAVEAIALGVDVHVTSAKVGTGVEALAEYAEGHRTVALIGPSGVGKSTLINALVGEERQATQDVRDSDGKGRHTTVARELVPLPNGGVLVDTPGLRAVALTDAANGIAATFPEIDALSAECRFRDCMHEGEPGCAVVAAVESGELAQDRLDSYLKLLKEAKNAAMRADVRLMRAEGRKWGTLRREVKKYRGQRR